MPYDRNAYWRPEFLGELSVLAAAEPCILRPDLEDFRYGLMSLVKIQQLLGIGLKAVAHPIAALALVEMDTLLEVKNWLIDTAETQPNLPFTIVAGNFSSGCCSLLEAFLDVHGARVIPVGSPNRDRRLRSIRPTVRAAGEDWLRALREEFGVNLPPSAEAALKDMIAFRNEYAHAPHSALQHDITADQRSGWPLAVLLLVSQVAV